GSTPRYTECSPADGRSAGSLPYGGLPDLIRYTPSRQIHRFQALLLGLVVADSVFGLIRALPEPVSVRCVINANETAATFRFHQIRSGEDWVNLELDRYRADMVVVIDRHP
ncbi:hypothetical protein, partial [Microtetraspora malaysiensis]